MSVDMEPVVSGLLGWVAGFVTSIPGGPVNATIVAEAPRRGLRWVVFLVLGFFGTQPVTVYGTIISQVGTLIYFAFFLLMPWYTQMEKTLPVPSRVTM